MAAAHLALYERKPNMTIPALLYRYYLCCTGTSVEVQDDELIGGQDIQLGR